MLDHVEFVTPADVRRRAEKRAKSNSCSVIEFAEIAELDERPGAIGEAYNLLLAAALRGGVTQTAQTAMLPLVERALQGAEEWLARVIGGRPEVRGEPDRILMKRLEVSNLEPWRDATIEAFACMIAMLQNARYSFTKIENAMVEANALGRFRERVESLWTETSKAIAELQRRRPKS